MIWVGWGLAGIVATLVPPVRCRGANDGRESTLVDVRPVRSGNHGVARLLDVPRHGARRPGKAWPGGAAPLAHRGGDPPVLRAWPGPRGTAVEAGAGAVATAELRVAPSGGTRSSNPR